MTPSPLDTREQGFWSLVRRATVSLSPAADAVADSTASSDPPNAEEIRQRIVSWLARLVLLYGLPFEYLVAHPAMLPNESMRFFLIDGNWLDRLVDGAASVGVGSSRDSVLALDRLRSLEQDARARAMTIRSELRGVSAPTAAASSQWSGFLLRSTAVSGWPGMEVQGFDAQGNLLPLLRMERLSPGVLMCLFAGVAASVNLTEPPETLHFGIGSDDSGPVALLRGLGFGGFDPGIQLPVDPNTNKHPSAPVSMRSGAASAGVMRASQTATNLKNALQAQKALSPDGTFTSAEFAIQMVFAAGLQTFQQQKGAN